MLKLNLQKFRHLMRRAYSLEKTLMLGKSEGREGAAEDEMARQYHQLGEDLDSKDIKPVNPKGNQS